jgi:hypothetical protein
LQIPSQPVPDDSQPSTPAQPILRPKKRHASTTFIVGISNFFFYYKYICVISNCFMLYMQPASTKRCKTTPAPSVHTRASPKGNQTTVSKYSFTHVPL